MKQQQNADRFQVIRVYINYSFFSRIIQINVQYAVYTIIIDTLFGHYMWCECVRAHIKMDWACAQCAFTRFLQLCLFACFMVGCMR